MSRMAHSSGIFSSAVTGVFFPLISKVNVGMVGRLMSTKVTELMGGYAGIYISGRALFTVGENGCVRRVWRAIETA